MMNKRWEAKMSVFLNEWAEELQEFLSGRPSVWKSKAMSLRLFLRMEISTVNEI